MNQPMARLRALKVFISYAHEDDALRQELVKHLSQLRREGLIADWHDRQITGGSQWAGAIDDNLEAADIVLLLVSASFLASDYCYDKELTRALARDDAGEARVIPVILRPCDWQTALFGKLQAFPTDGKAISKWQPEDDGYLEVARGLRRVISEILEHEQEVAGPVATPGPPRARLVRPPKRSLWMVAGLALLALVALGFGGHRWLGAKDLDKRKAALVQQQLLEPGKLNNEKFTRELDALLERAPNDPALITLDGDRNYRSGALPQARERYAKALERDPKLADAHFGLGLLADREGDLPTAQKHYKKAMDLAPGTPKYQNNYAHTFLESGLYKDAIAEYGGIQQYVLAGLEIAKAHWALRDLPQAQSQQARAIDWLKDQEIVALPRNQEAWGFFVETGQGGTDPQWKEILLTSVAEKRCYAGLSLSATLFLRNKNEEVKKEADAAGCSQSSEHVRELLEADLAQYVEKAQPPLAQRSRRFRERYLQSGS